MCLSTWMRLASMGIAVGGGPGQSRDNRTRTRVTVGVVDPSPHIHLMAANPSVRHREGPEKLRRGPILSLTTRRCRRGAEEKGGIVISNLPRRAICTERASEHLLHLAENTSTTTWQAQKSLRYLVILSGRLRLLRLPNRSTLGYLVKSWILGHRDLQEGVCSFDPSRFVADLITRHTRRSDPVILVQEPHMKNLPSRSRSLRSSSHQGSSILSSLLSGGTGYRYSPEKHKKKSKSKEKPAKM